MPRNKASRGLGSRRPACRALFAAFALFVLLAGLAGPAPARAAKYAAIVVNAETGEVLHAANPDTPTYPASLTKVMTLYLIFDAIEAKRLSWDTEVRMSARAARQPASRLGLPAGQSFTVRDGVLALIVRSANDVAAAFGEHLGGTERKFAVLMTKKAQALGMKDTTFRNASGLPHSQQLTTARDLATMVRALQREHPDYYKLFSTRSFSHDGRKYDNHNRLLDRYEGADGVKTGYIRASGFNLAASATREGIRLVSVVLGTRSPEVRDLHMMGLLERGFEKATEGRYIAYDYDRNLHVDPAVKKVPAAKRVARAEGARGRMALARLAPPRRPEEIARTTGEGSAADPELPVAPERKALDWEIQVGAFSRFAPAHLSATRAMRRLPSVLAHTRINIVPVMENGATLYRARLAGLDSERAERACELLKAKDMACRTVPPETLAGTLDAQHPVP